MPYQQLSIVVIGAGIGGLTAATALRRAGHRVTIYEKFSLAHEIGQGITIAPNGGIILRELGFDFKKARSVEWIAAGILNAATLEPLRPEISFESFDQKYGMRVKLCNRIQLHGALLDLAQSESGVGVPVKIVTDCGAKEWDGYNGKVVFESDQSVTADVVIAADGVKSTAARHVLGADCPPLESGDTVVYRFTLSKEQILANPLTSPLLDAGEGQCAFYASAERGRFLVRYWCRDDGQQNFALYCMGSHQVPEQQEHELRFKTDRTQLLEVLKDFHPALRRVVEMAEEVLPLWRCTTREPLSKFHSGKLVIIGDAAHPVKPHAGLGAISAIEDAGILGELFRDVPADVDPAVFVEERLKLFDKLRVGRLGVYKLISDIPFYENTYEKQKHNFGRFLQPPESQGSQDEIRPFYVGYDALGDARRILRESMS